MRKLQWFLPASLSLSLIACTPTATPQGPNQTTGVTETDSNSNVNATANTGTETAPATTPPTTPDTSSDTLVPVPPNASVTPPNISGSGCSPLVNINGSQIINTTTGADLEPLDSTANPNTVKGYIRLTSTLSCSTDVKSVQYMYRLVPSGEYIVIGALQQANDSYAFELNTPSILTDGSYELVTKATLNDGNIVLSSPLKINVDNVDNSSASGGGGGGGGGGTDTGGGGSTGNGPGNINFSVDTSFNIPPGTTRWTLDLGKQVSSTPLVDSQGNSFFAADNKFFIYDSNGVETARIELESEVTAPAARYGDFVYFGNANGELIKVNTTTPSAPVQKFTLSGTGSSARFEYNAPAIDCNGNVYIQTRDRKLFKVSADGNTTTQILEITDGDIEDLPAGATTTARYASPVVDTANNRVFTGSQNGIRIASLDGSNPASFIPAYKTTSTSGSSMGGEPGEATSALDRAINSPLGIDAEGKGYAISETGTLYKFDPASPGTEIWRTFVGDGDGAPVVGSDGTIYVASENGVLKAMNPADGTTEFEVGLGNTVEFSSPAIGRGADGNDVIYVGTEGGLLYSINGNNSPNAGTQRFVKDLGAPIRSDITIAADGTVYVGTLDGRMATIFGDSVGLANTPWPKAQGNLNGTGQIGSCS